MGADPRAVAALLLDLPWVRGLHTGPLGAIVTQAATGPVPGVLVDPRVIVVGLVVGRRVDRAQLAARVRARLARHVPGVPVILSSTAA